MDRLVSIPKRVSDLKAQKELTAISPDLFISIPKRVSEILYLGLLINFNIIHLLNKSVLNNLLNKSDFSCCRNLHKYVDI
jgi:hypothetical protein